jgi:UPF0271 protein
VTRATIDLNADLGEGAGTDESMLLVVSSASIACGGHTGDATTMQRALTAAAASGVVVGAHPSFVDREGFGRRPLDVAPDLLAAQIVGQIEALSEVARAAGVAVSFVKPHGALYNLAAVDAAYADAVITAVQQSGLRALLALAGSVLHRRAAAAGLVAYGEAFADRRYTAEGTLVSRSTPGSVITDPAEVVAQAVAVAAHGRVRAIDGSLVEVAADSLCLHGDTQGAADLARAVLDGLVEAGVDVAPFVR